MGEFEDMKFSPEEMELILKLLYEAGNGNPFGVNHLISVGRIYSGLSRRELARRTGINHSTLSRLEEPESKVVPDLRTIAVLMPYIKKGIEGEGICGINEEVNKDV